MEYRYISHENFGKVISQEEYDGLNEEEKKKLIENVFDTGDRGDINEDGDSAFRDRINTDDEKANPADNDR